MLKFLFIYLLVVNVLAFLVYWWDKRKAEKGARRVAERELLLWALAGGSLGSWLAMNKFRHKTAKASFKLAFFAIVLLQVGGVLWIVWN